MSEILYQPDPECPPDTMYLLPQVRTVVFYLDKGPAPTWEQEIMALVNAYGAAAIRGDVGVITECRR